MEKAEEFLLYNPPVSLPRLARAYSKASVSRQDRLFFKGGEFYYPYFHSLSKEIETDFNTWRPSPQAAPIFLKSIFSISPDSY
jgi:hypothetical protein